ncbi:hypothetical protein CASFOL_040472 [Castilleja foliolosa]|uniref:Uncharacterized protein n=1 Tax=Castilleja foliolosa TaxID=1961234 RepID=A0ABD3BBQ3_9LAMI
MTWIKSPILITTSPPHQLPISSTQHLIIINNAFFLNGLRTRDGKSRLVHRHHRLKQLNPDGIGAGDLCSAVFLPPAFNRSFQLGI